MNGKWFLGDKNINLPFPLILYQFQIQFIHQSFDVRILFDELIKQKLPWLLLQKIIGNVQSFCFVLFGSPVVRDSHRCLH